MYYISVEKSFDAAHFLKGYEGKCRNIHGHRWKVVALARSEKLSDKSPDRGMVLDFGVVKKALSGICSYFDHSLIYERGSLKEASMQALEEEDFRLREVEFTPTAENFAAYIYRELSADFPQIYRVEVYETPGNCAAYEQ